MKRYVEALLLHLSLEALPLDMPLFPDYTGAVVKKAGVVGGMEKALVGLGVEVVYGAGKRRYGGHSMRVTGAPFWSSNGLEVFKVQIFAR